MTPDISVIIPVYRADLTIARAIRSCLSQSVSVEVVCVDDCPVHPTHCPITDERIRWIVHEKNGGPGAALETAANAATGKYLLMLGDDDYLEPGCLAPLLQAMEANPALAFTYGATRYHGLRSDLYSPPAFRREDFYQHFPALYGYVWRRDWKALRGLKYQDELFEFGRWCGAPDWDMALQLLRHGDGLALPDVTVLNHLLRQGRMTEAVKTVSGQVMASMRGRHPQLSESAAI